VGAKPYLRSSARAVDPGYWHGRLKSTPSARIALDFYTPDCVYGLQGTPYGGGGVETSTLIDLDGEITQQDKTVYGDVELPIPGDVSPVQPPG